MSDMIYFELTFSGNYFAILQFFDEKEWVHYSKRVEENKIFIEASQDVYKEMSFFKGSPLDENFNKIEKIKEITLIEYNIAKEYDKGKVEDIFNLETKNLNDFKKVKLLYSSNISNIYTIKEIKSGNYFVLKEINNKKYKEKYKSIFKYEKKNLKNIIPIRKIIYNEKYSYIIMDLGLCNLEEYIKTRNKSLSIEEIKIILKQLNNILKYINKDDDYIDLNPLNIIIFLIILIS